jgi:hypothetical protein
MVNHATARFESRSPVGGHQYAHAMATANEVAQTMLKYMRDSQSYSISYKSVLYAVRDAFGEDWLVRNRRNREVLSPAVTKAFRAINDGEFVWEAPRQRWRTVSFG